MMSEGNAEIREVKLDESVNSDRPVSANVEQRDLTATSLTGQRSSYIAADSISAMGVHDPNSFFFKKYPLEQLDSELEKAATSQGDSSQIIKFWLLKQIDHWNNDHEMVCGLSEQNLYLMKFDFVTRKRRGNLQVIKLSNVTTVTQGNITYPNYSALERRDPLAVRIAWGNTENVSFLQKWNPLCNTIPYCVLSNHPFIMANPEVVAEVGRSRFDVNDFVQEFLQITRKSNPSVTVNQEPIIIQCYIGASSLVFNQSQLGFSKDRNGVSF